MRTTNFSLNLAAAKFVLLLVVTLANSTAWASPATLAPLYKPSSRAAQAQDIRTPSYGASRTAPNALTIGDRVPDFVLPKVGGGEVALAELRRAGDVAIIFYRGHW